MKTIKSPRRATSSKLVAGGLLVALLAPLGACGGGACAELDAKKGECSKDGPNKEMCEKAVAAAVQASNQDACKTMLDNMAKKK
jgi:hypothetical protein